MNPDNNFGNGMGQDNIGSQNLGGFTPSNEPISPVGPIEQNTPNVEGETFNPFTNLDAPVQSATDTPSVNSVPVSSEGLFDNVSIPSVNNEAPSVETPTFNFDANINPQPEAAPVTPVQPVADTPNVAPETTTAPLEPSPISDLENNVNSALNAALEMPVADEFKNPEAQAVAPIAPVQPEAPQGPTIPIPDQMPTSTYQAGVSTPVDYATPMSDFDQIGTTPELDPKAKSTKKSNKSLVFLLLLLGIAILGAGSYYLINVKKIFNTASVVTKDLTVEKDSVLSTDINKYATFKNTSSSNCVQDLTKVDTSIVGSYSYSIKCGEDVYEGKITVVDTTAPDLYVQAVNVNINQGESVKPESFVNKCSESDCLYSYVDASQIATEAASLGIKFIGISVADGSGNAKTVYAPLVVLDSTLKYEGIASKDAGISNDKYTVTENDYVFFTESFVTYTVYEFKFYSAEEFDKLVKENVGNLNVAIESIAGSAVFNKDTLTIYIVPEAKSEYANADYFTSYNQFTQNGYSFITKQVNELKLGFGD